MPVDSLNFNFCKFDSLNLFSIPNPKGASSDCFQVLVLAPILHYTTSCLLELAYFKLPPHCQHFQSFIVLLNILRACQFLVPRESSYQFPCFRLYHLLLYCKYSCCFSRVSITFQAFILIFYICSFGISL